MYLKRVIDLVASIILFILLCPIFAIIAIAIKLDSPGPVFFRQERLGFDGHIFRIWKFRSMVNNAEFQGAGLLVSRTDARITRVGQFLRLYRLDELPQLINVIKGEMSLVGPRPLLPDFWDLYSETDRKRLLMPPGMTGWQQINGAANNTWEERIALDVWYVEHWNVWFDMIILMRTIEVVIKADSVYGKDGWQRSGAPKIEDEPISVSQTKPQEESHQ